MSFVHQDKLLKRRVKIWFDRTNDGIIVNYGYLANWECAVEAQIPMAPYHNLFDRLLNSCYRTNDTRMKDLLVESVQALLVRTLRDHEGIRKFEPTLTKNGG